MQNQNQKVFKNYAELAEALGEPVHKGGKLLQQQLASWNKKYILKREGARGIRVLGMRSVDKIAELRSEIQKYSKKELGGYLLVNYLSSYTNGHLPETQTLTFEPQELDYILGLVGEDYKKLHKAKKELKPEIKSIYSDINYLNKTFMVDVLEYLSDRFIINWRKTYLVLQRGQPKVADDDLLAKITETYSEVLTQFNFKTLADVKRKQLGGSFYPALFAKLQEELGVTDHREVYSINTTKNQLEAFFSRTSNSKEILEEIRQRNESKNSETFYLRAEAKYLRYMQADKGFGMGLSPLDIFTEEARFNYIKLIGETIDPRIKKLLSHRIEENV